MARRTLITSAQAERVKLAKVYSTIRGNRLGRGREVGKQ